MTVPNHITIEMVNFDENDQGEIDTERIKLTSIEVPKDDLYLSDSKAIQYSKLYKDLQKMVNRAGGTDKVIPYLPKRSETEVRGGYKIALQRGAKLNDVYVYNSLFKISNDQITSDVLAVTWPMVEGSDKEWIILFPVDTALTIQAERRRYLDEARKLVFFKQTMSPDVQNSLVENLDFIDENINERCAQTLMHEYGHVLHSRMFSYLGLNTDKARFTWYFTSGYAHHLSKRFPKFGGLDAVRKFYYLNEALAEDFRISLNSESKNGMFILPNKIGFLGDFQFPEYINEGVTLMKKMLEPAISRTIPVGELDVHSFDDLDRVKLTQFIHDRAEHYNWSPGEDLYSEQDFLKDLEAFDDDGSFKSVPLREPIGV